MLTSFVCADHFHFQLQADITVRMYARRKVDIHANIQVGELRITSRAIPPAVSSGESKA